MRWSITLGTIKGIKIKMHLTFLLVIAWGSFRYGDGNGWQGLVFGAVLVLLVFGIVLLHELGHSLVALRFGVTVRDIILLPIGGVARLEKMPEKPFHEFMVAIAGPAVNFAFVVLLFPILWWGTTGNIWYQLLRSVGNPQLSGWWLMQFLFWVNLSLLVFNIIPAFPLDGGRILRSLLAIWLDYQKATRIAVWIGQGFAFLLGGFAFFEGNILTALVALFIFSAGGAEGRSVTVKRVLDKIRAGEILGQIHTVLHPDFTMMEVAGLTFGGRQTKFPVLAEDTLIGIIRRGDIRKALERGRKETTVAEVMHRDFPALGADAPLSEVQAKLIASDSSVAAIYKDTQLMGLIDFDDIQHAFYHLKPV